MEKRLITFYLKNTKPIDIIDESDQTIQEIQVEIKRLFTTKQVIMFENEKEFLIIRPSELITVKVGPHWESIGKTIKYDEFTISDDNLTSNKKDK